MRRRALLLAVLWACTPPTPAEQITVTQGTQLLAFQDKLRAARAACDKAARDLDGGDRYQFFLACEADAGLP